MLEEKNIFKKVHNFHHYPTWFLASIYILGPLKQIIIERSCMEILKHQHYDEPHMFLTKPTIKL
jgi:hypothetical protein